MELEQYQKLKKQVETLRSEAERAAGRLDQLMKQLGDEFGCKTLDEATAKLRALEVERTKAEQVFDKKYKLFQAEWGEQLKEVVG